MRFGADARPDIKKAHPDMPITEVAKEVGKKWQALSDKEKKPYNDAYQKEKAELAAAAAE
jgi:hypothetical protein